MYTIDQLSTGFARFLESNRPSARFAGEFEDIILTKIDLADVLDVRGGRFDLVLAAGLRRFDRSVLESLGGSARSGSAEFKAVGVFDRKGRELYQIAPFLERSLLREGVERECGDDALEAGISEVRQWVLESVMRDLASRPDVEGSVLDGLEEGDVKWMRDTWKSRLFRSYVENGDMRDDGLEDDVRETIVNMWVGSDDFFYVLDKGPNAMQGIVDEILDSDRYQNIADSHDEWLAAVAEFGPEVEKDASWARDMSMALAALDAKTVKLNFVNEDGQEFSTGIELSRLHACLIGRCVVDEYWVETPTARIPEWLFTTDWRHDLDMSKAAEPFVTFRGKQVGPNAPEDEDVWFLGRK